MYAVIKTGGKQYAVEPGDRLFIERLDTEQGAQFAFDRVLYLNADDSVRVGTPYLDAVRVLATTVENGKAKKVVTFKYKAKKDYRKKRGHRQPYTLVEIDAITVDGEIIARKPEIAEEAIPEESAEAEAPLGAGDAAEPEAETPPIPAAEPEAEAEAEKAAAEEAKTPEAEAPPVPVAEPEAEKPAADTARKPGKAEKAAADTAEKPAAKRTAKPKAEKAAADKAEPASEKPKRTAKPKAEKVETETAEKPAVKRTAKPKAKNADAAPAVSEEEK